MHSKKPPLRIGWLLALCCLSIAHAVDAGPRIQHWRTGNGARVYFIAAPALPMVDAQVAFAAGSARDAELPGLARFTNALLDDGAGSWSGDQIAERFDNLGARLQLDARRDMAWVALRSLTRDALLEQSSATVAALLAAPSFPQAALERQRKRMQVALRKDMESPGANAERAFYARVFKGHPYGSPPKGTAESLQAVTREQVARFHRRYYVAKNASVAIVGALDRAGAEALAESLVGELPAGERAESLPRVAALQEAEAVRLDHPSTQTHVILGQPGIARADADYFPLYVGNHILGGSGLVSRLSEEIRERRGLSYSVSSYFLPMERPGPYRMGLQTQNDKADQALGLLRGTLKRFLEEGPTEQEMDAAKKNITGGFALRIDTNRKQAEYLAMLGFYNLPLDYLDTFNDQVTAVTREQIQDAFRRRLNPERMITVMVGGGAPNQK